MLDRTRHIRSRSASTARAAGRARRAALALACVVAASGCSRIEAVFDGETRVPASPHETYLMSLERAGLGGTPLVERWQTAARAALEAPVEIDPPFHEVAYYPAEEPAATAYAVTMERGQALRATLDTQPADTTGVFLDVFQRDPAGRLQLVASASPGSRQIEFEPPREGTFVLRVQPELLRSVRISLSVLRAATLAFPVEGHGMRDIGSRFGAAREGGRRSHHGVDIFARRGTPVLAAVEAVVSRVQDTRLGGRVVWLRDAARRRSLYYAHLDRQLVREGQRVRPGDTLGLVGNSGNARTTPPHLHFGIYVRREGPVDPFHYLNRPPTRAPEVRADSSRLGSWVRLAADARLAGPAAAQLERHTVVRVVAAYGRELRMRLPDGRVVSVQDASLEPIDVPIEVVAVARGQPILAWPEPLALPAAHLDEEGPVPVVGRFGGYRLVRASSGAEGWVASTPLTQDVAPAP